ncbi:hypothetical protein CCACVL1_08051, partial [Corchorus capsularis]
VTLAELGKEKCHLILGGLIKSLQDQVKSKGNLGAENEDNSLSSSPCAFEIHHREGEAKKRVVLTTS